MNTKGIISYVMAIFIVLIALEIISPGATGEAADFVSKNFVILAFLLILFFLLGFQIRKRTEG